MRRTAALACAALALAAAAQTVVPRKTWKVETSAPVAQRLDLWYGETVDLEAQFLSYTRAMDLTNAVVTLHARTNGMAEGTSWQATGEARGNGVAAVRLAVDSWVPRGLSSAEYTLEVVQTNAARVMRGHGTAYFNATAVSSTNEPLPTAWATNYVTLAQFTAATGSVYAAAAAYADAATGAVASAASAALAAYAATSTPSHIALADQIIDGTGGVWRVSVSNLITLTVPEDLGVSIPSTTARSFTFAAPTSETEQSLSLDSGWTLWLWPEGGTHDIDTGYPSYRWRPYPYEYAGLNEDVEFRAYNTVNAEWVLDAAPITLAWISLITTNLVDAVAYKTDLAVSAVSGLPLTNGVQIVGGWTNGTRTVEFISFGTNYVIRLAP